MSRFTAVVTATRILTAVIFVALLVFGVRSRSEPRRPQVITAATETRALATELASNARGPIVYDDSVPPDRGIAGLLAAGSAAGRAVSLRVPAERPTLSVQPPLRPVAQRRAALTVAVRGDPDEPVHLTVEHGDRVDTLTVRIGAAGSSTVRISVEPSRVGTERWTVRARSVGDPPVSAVATATAWVRPAAPLRVLALTGPPGWETRHLLRALETAGHEVTVRQDLGRDLVVATQDAPTPTSLTDFRSYDIVVSAGTIPPAALESIDRWVRESGGGHLALVGEDDTARALSAADLEWSGPAEVIPLPALDIDLMGTRLPRTPGSGEVAIASTEERGGSRESAAPVATFVSASAPGRGRTLTSGLETWSWVLSGNAADAHMAYWSSVMQWLSGGLTGEALIAGSAVQPYTAWGGRIEGAVPGVLSVESDLGAQLIPVSHTGAGEGTFRFVPTTAGAHTFSATEGTAITGTVVRAAGEKLSWVEASLEVGGAGGAIIPVVAADRVDGTPLATRDRRAWFLFLALAGLTGAGWATRRLQGLA